MINQITVAFSRLIDIWEDKNISLASVAKLMQALIISTLKYACKSLPLTADWKEESKHLRCDASKSV